MLALNQFTIVSGDAELRISALRRTANPSGAISLPHLGAFGELDLECSRDNRRLPSIAFEDEENRWDSCEPLRLEENAEYEVSVTLPLSPSAYDFLAVQDGGETFPFADSRLAKALSMNPLNSMQSRPDGRIRMTGRLKFDNYVGTVNLSLSEALATISLRAEVISHKLDYESDFPALLNALWEIESGIMLSADEPTAASFLQADRDEASPQMLLMLLRWILHSDRLPSSVASIMANPITRLKSDSAVHELAFVTSPDLILLQSRPHSCVWEHGGALSAIFSGMTPLSLPNRTVERHVDVLENQYIKFCVKELILLANNVARRLPKRFKASKRWLERQSGQLNDLLTNSFWQQIGNCNEAPSTMVMFERNGYRDVMQYISMLHTAVDRPPDIGERDSVTGDLRPIWELYELWCYFELRGLLAQLTGDEGRPPLGKLMRVGDYETSLESGQGSTRFDLQHGDGFIGLDLYRTRQVTTLDKGTDSWEHSYSGRFKPDLSLRISIGNVTHWLHFDAKYRATAETRKRVTEVAAGEDGEEVIRWMRSDDIAVAHQYRDAILGTRGCYVLYPGNTNRPAIYVRHGSSVYRASQVLPSVGAFPLCPSQTDMQLAQRKLLSDHIHRCITELAIAQDYKEECGIESRLSPEGSSDLTGP